MGEIKRCALMRQSWYEAAKKNMKDGARLAFYEACFDFEFYGRDPEPTLFDFTDANLLFDVVRDDLQRDMIKAETIAARNRRNGLLGGRPPKQRDELSGEPGDLSKSTKPKETQQNPDKPSGFFGITTTCTNTLHTSTDKSVSVQSRKKRHKDIDRYTYFRVMFVFFYSGATDVAAETEKFYNYYQARDWQVGRGQAVRDKVALAKTWDIKDADPSLIEARRGYAGLIEAIDPEEPELLTDFISMRQLDDIKQLVIRMTNGNRLLTILEEQYLGAMTIYFTQQLKLEGYSLEYQCNK